MDVVNVVFILARSSVPVRITRWLDRLTTITTTTIRTATARSSVPEHHWTARQVRFTTMMTTTRGLSGFGSLQRISSKGIYKSSLPNVKALLVPHSPSQQQQQQQRNFTRTPNFKMQENVAKLYPNPETSAKVMEYSVAKSTPLPDWLVKYQQWGCENTEVPSYLTSTYQGQMMAFLARIVGAKNGE